MTPPDDRGPAGRCDADTGCRQAPCFQVQLEAWPPAQPEASCQRHANACAHHVPEVIQGLRGWAREHDLADGQLTILVIEAAAGGRQLSQPGGTCQPELRGFAFSTIPLQPVQRDTGSRLTSGAAPADPEP